MTQLASWVAGRYAGQGETYERANPADRRDVMGPYLQASAADVNEAIAAAEHAQGAWSAKPAPGRGDLVMRVAGALRARASEIAAIITREEGKTIAEAEGEVAYAASVFEFIGAGGRWVAGDAVDSAHATTINLTRREPLGVVAAITPWNFPVSLPAIKIASALTAGNGVIWKPASYTPASALALTECMIEAGIPQDLFSTLLGNGEIGRQLVNDSRIRAITFTGSTSVGLWIAANAGMRGARTQLEMGGKNAIVVLADANIAAAARETALGAFQSAGQKCTAASRVVVERGVRDKFVEALVEETRKLKVGDPTDRTTQISPMVAEKPLEDNLAAIAAAKAAGSRLLIGGERLGDALAHGNFMSPAVLDAVDPASELAQEELFGPVLAVIEAADFADAVRIVNGTAYGLAASVYTADLQKAFNFIKHVQAGKVKVNSSPTGGDHHIPFGGWKNSGAGSKELGRTALEFFSEEKSIYINHLGFPA